MAKVYFPGGETQNLVNLGPNGKVTLEQAQILVGGLVDVIELNATHILIIADDFIGQDFNLLASLITSAVRDARTVICGVAVQIDTRTEGWGRYSQEEE